MPDQLIAFILSVAGGAIGGVVTYLLWLQRNLQEIRRAYDQELRTARLIAYGKLWQEFEPLAVYSPDNDVSYERLAELGAALRRWYFQQGGLLLTDRARNAYFLVQDAIGSIEQQTNTPAVVRPRAKQWTRRTLDRAREQLRLASLPAAQARPGEHAAWENRLSATLLATSTRARRRSWVIPSA